MIIYATTQKRPFTTAFGRSTMGDAKCCVSTFIKILSYCSIVYKLLIICRNIVSANFFKPSEKNQMEQLSPNDGNNRFITKKN
jgi:hypothetical protein